MNKILIFMFVLLLIAGCLEEVQLPLAEKMVFSEKLGDDIDGDGELDIAYFKFSPLEVEIGGKKARIFIEKWVFIYPKEFEVTVENRYNPEAIADITSSFQLINDATDIQERECRQNLVMELCNDYKSCIKSCNLAVCKEYPEGREELGIILKDFKDIVEERDKTLDLLENSIITLKLTNTTEDASIALTKLYVLNKIIENHPAVKMLGLCNPRYPDSIYRDAKKYFGEIKINSMDLLVNYRVQPVSLTGVMEINGNDRLPNALSAEISKVSILKDYRVISKFPLTIDFPAIKMDTATNEISYTYKLTTESTLPSVYLEVWVGGDIILSTFTLKSQQLSLLIEKIYEEVYLPTYNLFGLSYLAFSMVFILIVVALVLLKEILVYFYNLTLNISKGVSVAVALKKSLGEADIQARQNAIYGIVILAITLALELTLGKNLFFESFDLFFVREMFRKDYVLLLTLLGYISSSYFLMIFVVDAFKGLLGGKEYYRKVEALSPKGNRKLLETLRKEVDEALGIVHQLAQEGMDVGKIYEFFAEVPINEIEELLNKNMQIEANKKIRYYLERVREEKAKLISMKETAEESLQKWLAYLEEELEKRDVIALDSLIVIPRQWRIWVVKKYISLHPDEDLILEGNVVKRERLTLEQKAEKVFNTLISKKKIVAGFLAKKGKLLKAVFAEGRKSVMNNLSYKMLASFIADNYVKLEGFGNFFVTKMLKIGDNIIFYIANKSESQEVENYLMTKLNR